MKTKVQDIVSGIIAQKEAKGLTSQQIADLSGVSKSTIDRLLRNDPIASTNAQTLFDVADAVGYRIGGVEEDPEIQRIVTIYEGRIRQTGLDTRRSVKYLKVWNCIFATLCLILFAFIIVMLLIDVAHPNIGWIRDHLQNYVESAYRILLSI